MDCYMGTILPFAFNYAPSYFDFCNGQQYRVSQYQALFALLGKFYGGDGVTTFNLPNLQGRMPIGFGQLQTVIHNMGDTGGTANVQLSTANMPAHTHTPALQVKLQASGTANPTTPASIPSAQAPFIGASGGGTGLATIWSTTLKDPVDVGGTSITGQLNPTGGNVPVSVMNPFLAINFCIAITGIFPMRND